MIISPGTKVYDANGVEYEVGPFLGNGSFGFVNKIESIKKKETYAIKTVLPGFTSAEAERSFFNEGEQALKIINENVIRYYGDL